MNWRKIECVQNEKRFYINGKPVFKQYRSLLKFHEPGLAPVEDESGWYHITAAGEPLYKTRYIRVFGFYCGFASVTLRTGCFHIDSNGNALYSERYAWTGNFQENICAVRDKNGLYFHIGSDGERLYAQNYSYVGDFRDGVACVKCLDGLWRHIDRHANFFNGRGFLDIGVFHKNIAPAKDQKGWFHSDLDGNPLYQERYLAIEPFYNGFALVTEYDLTKKIIDEAGREVLRV